MIDRRIRTSALASTKGTNCTPMVTAAEVALHTPIRNFDVITASLHHPQDSAIIKASKKCEGTPFLLFLTPPGLYMPSGVQVWPPNVGRPDIACECAAIWLMGWYNTVSIVLCACTRPSKVVGATLCILSKKLTTLSRVNDGLPELGSLSLTLLSYSHYNLFALPYNQR